MRRCLFLLWLITLAAASVAHGATLCVLAFRPAEQARAQWQPTADYLQARLADTPLALEVLAYPELEQAMAAGRCDFVLTNPEHYVRLRRAYELAAIATLMPLAEGHPVSQFAGVIFTRADRADIRTLQDLRGKRVAAVDERSFGGYLMQRWELYRQGVGIEEFAGLILTGMPHDRVVMAVLAGEADAGFVRSGVLEQMAREGKIRLNAIRVLNRHPQTDFPLLHSTARYPEWPFAVLPRVPEAMRQSVQQALFDIAPDSPAARYGNYFGFAPPADYAPVEAVMERIGMLPRSFTLRDVIARYQWPLLAGALLLLLLAAWGLVHLARSNRRLAASLRENRQLEKNLREANAMLEARVAERTAALQASEARFRHMFEHHASPMLLIDPESGAIVDANPAAAAFYGYPVARLRTMNISAINTLPPEEIARERQNALKERRNHFEFPHRLADGSEHWVEVHSSPVEVEGRTLLFSVIHDITERRRLQREMRELAYYDPLTHLPNRRLLHDRLRQALAAHTRSGKYGALMFLDLDHFKTLNDVHGHEIGDALLMEVAHRLLAAVRTEDTVARLGGDEFVVLLEELSGDVREVVRRAEVVAEKIRASLAQPYILPRATGDEITHHCSSSIGITLFGPGDTVEAVLKQGDIAMYRAKEAGRNKVRFFDIAMQHAVETRAALEEDLRQALAEGQFELFYQVQVDAGKRPHGAEVLLSWRHPQRGWVSPAEFIPVAEETGLILPIGAWVLDAACAQLKAWQADPMLRDLTLSVNISANQFYQDDFAAKVADAIGRHGIAPGALVLELTESMVLRELDVALAHLRALRALGVRLSLDDFGTGYSSLTYLKRLPFDELKIDQSFVRDIEKDNMDRLMVMTMVDLAINFKLRSVAEGVENEAQFLLLQKAGCLLFQGYLFGKPMPAAAFAENVRHLDAQSRVLKAGETQLSA